MLEEDQEAVPDDISWEQAQGESRSSGPQRRSRRPCSSALPGQVAWGSRPASPAGVLIPIGREAAVGDATSFLHPDRRPWGRGEGAQRAASPPDTRMFTFPHACAFHSSPARRHFVLLQLQLFLFAAAAVALKGLFSHGMLSN